MLRTALFSLAALLLGCERPFVEPQAPSVELVSPADLGEVRAAQDLSLAFEASSPSSGIDRVEVNGVPATFDRDDDRYLATVRLEQGLNRITVEAFDGLGTVGGDTLFAVFLPFQFASSETRLPGPVGGHATTALADGTLLLTGGAGGAAEPARSDALLLDPSTLAFTSLRTPMLAARAGHAASLLPDGRVLITGGSAVVRPAGASAFVTTAELFDPSTRTFSEVPLVAADGGLPIPVQRSGHTVAVLDSGEGDVSVYLYGGTANLGTADAPRLGPSPFMRRLVFEDGPSGPRLVAPNRSEGFRFAATSGHTQTPRADVGPDGFGRYLFAGASDVSDPATPLPFELTFAPETINTRFVGPLQTPRADHAAARLAGPALSENLVLFTGGLRASDGAALPSGEVFAAEAAQSFRFADNTRLAAPRWGHTATNVGDARILVVGGFSASGTPLDLIELFTALPAR
ncbi:MAG: kelch repeat-containing protein [Bacteroidota bacterium]